MSNFLQIFFLSTPQFFEKMCAEQLYCSSLGLNELHVTDSIKTRFPIANCLYGSLKKPLVKLVFIYWHINSSFIVNLQGFIF
jgi:hypothetical protein